jgi:predicted metalloprotease with PDZ domain
MPGSTSVIPMASSQMAPGSYAGTVATPNITYYTPVYASPSATTGDYATQPSGNVVQRRGAATTVTPAPRRNLGIDEEPIFNPVYVAPAESAATTVMPAPGRSLGIDADPITDAIGQRGMKVTSVYPDSAAERAGLRVGDVIYASNGYLTEKRGDLAWIIANAAPDSRLNMSVKTARDRREHFLTAQFP